MTKDNYRIEPITKTYLHLEELRLTKKNNVTRAFFRIPNTFEITKHPKRRKSVGQTLQGRSTSLNKKQYFGLLLLLNEIQGCLHEATDRQGILRHFRKEYTSMTGKTADHYLNKYSEYRGLYNTGHLSKDARYPPLYAWTWRHDSYIHLPRHLGTLLSFQYCKRHLTKAKFADPRFFNQNELDTYRNNTAWHVPAVNEIEEIESKIKKPLYDSIEWPEGYSKEFNPI